MTWWGVLVLLLALLAIDVTVTPWAQRVVVRRRMRAGQAPVSARSFAPGPGTLPAQWTACRVTPEAGRPVLRRLHDLWSAPGFDLLAVAGPDRPVPTGELLDGARRAVPFRSSAGLVEIAARDEVLAWLEAQLAPADPA